MLQTKQDISGTDQLKPSLAANVIGELTGLQDRMQVRKIYSNVARRVESFRVVQSCDEKESPASSETIELAYIALSRIFHAAKDMGRTLPEPYTYLTPEGSIQFEWELGEKEFNLELTSQGSQTAYSFLLCPSPSPDTWQEASDKVTITRISQPPCVQTFLSWL